MAKQGTKASRVVRLQEVEKALALGMSLGEVQHRFAAKFDVSLRTIRRDIEVIHKRWAEESESERPYRRHQMRRMLAGIVQRAQAAGKFSAAAQAAGRLMELDGLKQLEVKHSGAVDLAHSGSMSHKHNVDAMTSEEKRRKLATYLEVIQERRDAGEDDEAEADGRHLTQ